MTDDQRQEMLDGYIDGVFDTERDGDDDSLDENYLRSDFAAEALDRMKADCDKFLLENGEDLARLLLLHQEGKFELTPACVGVLDLIGYHFWTTRNGHGTGFWNGLYPEEIGERLTKSSEGFGEFNVYVGDDGFLYGS